MSHHSAVARVTRRPVSEPVQSATSRDRSARCRRCSGSSRARAEHREEPRPRIISAPGPRCRSAPCHPEPGRDRIAQVESQQPAEHGEPDSAAHQRRRWRRARSDASAWPASRNSTGRSRPRNGATSSCAAQNAWPDRCRTRSRARCSARRVGRVICCSVGSVAMPALTRMVSAALCRRHPRRRSPNSLPVVCPSPPSTSAVTDHRVSRTPVSRTYAPPKVPSSTGGLGGKSPEPPRKSFSSEVRLSRRHSSAARPFAPTPRSSPVRKRRLVAERSALRQRVVARRRARRTAR